MAECKRCHGDGSCAWEPGSYGTCFFCGGTGEVAEPQGRTDTQRLDWLEAQGRSPLWREAIDAAMDDATPQPGEPDADGVVEHVRDGEPEVTEEGWAMKAEDFRETLEYINDTPALLSALYDLNLLPEQLTSCGHVKDERGWNTMRGVVIGHRLWGEPDATEDKRWQCHR